MALELDCLVFNKETWLEEGWEPRAPALSALRSLVSIAAEADFPWGSPRNPTGGPWWWWG